MPYHIASFIGIVLQTSANDDDDDNAVQGRPRSNWKLLESEQFQGWKHTEQRPGSHRRKKKELPLVKSEEHSTKGGVGGKSLAIF